jgi:hypothetical protein
MSDEEFLARWSRRKREAKEAVDAPPTIGPTATPDPEPPAKVEDRADVEVDLSSLPPIESITEGTDIAAFLRKGIPPELSRAALRRAWAADPAIRDFVGLAENAWDFNDPDAMPGFGPLDCSQEQLAALVDRIVGGVRRAADSLATVIAEQEDASQPADTVHKPPSELRTSEAVADLNPAEETSSDQPPAPAAMQPQAPGVESDQTPVRRRTHGTALPR